MAKINQKNIVNEMPVEEKLRALYELQTVVSQVDAIRVERGELPLEVQYLEDEIAGIEVRIAKKEAEVKRVNDAIIAKNMELKDCATLLKKYEAQQMAVRNSREFDSLKKEVEYQSLNSQLYDKQLREFNEILKRENNSVTELGNILTERKGDLAIKKVELETIVSETKDLEEQLLARIDKLQSNIEERLVSAFNRIRSNARNGLAVVTVARNACGGCFNQIPPQMQVEIRTHKKVIVCEYCGRILVDYGNETQE